MANRFDIVLNGISYRLRRSGADGVIGYVRRLVRKRIQRQDTGVQNAYVSDPNKASAYQTSWSRGSAWWKPSLVQEPDSYYLARNMNLWRKPGQIEPWNNPVGSDISAWHTISFGMDLASLGNNDLYCVGSTTTVDGTNLDIYKWTASTATWAVTAHTVGVAGASPDTVYDLLLDEVLFRVGSSIYEYDGTGAATELIALAATISNSYSSMFLHDGRLMVYGGDTLVEVSDRAGTPTEVEITDDGFGSDWVVTAGSSALIGALTLAVSTAEGVYYVKNVEQAGSVVAYVFRVERDNVGNWNSVPIATLPRGNVALSIGYHLGSVIISASSDAYYLLSSAYADVGSFPVTLYHVTGGNLGVIGQPLGEGVADETPYEILMADGPYLYIGGQKRIWVYDAVRGGIHPFFEFATASQTHPCRVMVKVNNTSLTPNQPYFMLHLTDISISSGAYQEFIPTKPAAALATVTTFNTDLSTMYLESNYFDFDLPMENKSITGVHVLTDAISTNAQYTVQVAVDDGAFATVAQHNGSATGYGFTEFPGSPVTGKRFRYKIAYETKVATTAVPLRSIMFESTVGRMVWQWVLQLDGTEFGNVEGTVVRPEDAYDNVEALGASGVPVAMSDYFRSDRREDYSEYVVTVENVEMKKDQPSEGYFDVTIEEA